MPCPSFIGSGYILTTYYFYKAKLAFTINNDCSHNNIEVTLHKRRNLNPPIRCSTKNGWNGVV